MAREEQLNLLREQRIHPLEPLKPMLKQWAGRGVLFGTSSWKYEGWIGQVYTRARYLVGSRFSKARFEQHCLEEYAEIFPSVCGDFSFYQFYSADFWRRLFAQVPPTFQFGFKAQEIITAPSFPDHARYGVHRGKPNETFLNHELFRREFLDLVAPYHRQVGYIVFQFPQLPAAVLGANHEFLDRLDRFLGALPDLFRYGVEIRNENLLGPEYFQCLRQRGVSHVFNSWTRMPPIRKQLERPGSITSDLVISRVLLKPGRTYEQAVQQFQPYREMRDQYPQGFRDVAALVRTARTIPNTRVFVAVNNRFVGNAIYAIEEILTELGSPAA